MAEQVNISDEVRARINAVNRKASFTVTAVNGVWIDNKEYAQGDKVSLPSAVADALIREGSLEEDLG